MYKNDGFWKTCDQCGIFFLAIQVGLFEINIFLNLEILLTISKMFHGLHPIGISAMYSQNCDVHSHDTRKKKTIYMLP